jgi:CBS domain-containing protein
MIARELMTPDPLSVSPQATVAEVWDLMREADIRHVPVVEADGLVGM